MQQIPSVEGLTFTASRFREHFRIQDPLYGDTSTLELAAQQTLTLYGMSPQLYARAQAAEGSVALRGRTVDILNELLILRGLSIAKLDGGGDLNIQVIERGIQLTPSAPLTIEVEQGDIRCEWTRLLGWMRASNVQTWQLEANQRLVLVDIPPTVRDALVEERNWEPYLREHYIPGFQVRVEVFGETVWQNQESGLVIAGSDGLKVYHQRISRPWAAFAASSRQPTVLELQTGKPLAICDVPTTFCDIIRDRSRRDVNEALIRFLDTLLVPCGLVAAGIEGGFEMRINPKFGVVSIHSKEGGTRISLERGPLLTSIPLLLDSMVRSGIYELDLAPQQELLLEVKAWVKALIQIQQTPLLTVSHIFSAHAKADLGSTVTIAPRGEFTYRPVVHQPQHAIIIGGTEGLQIQLAEQRWPLRDIRQRFTRPGIYPLSCFDGILLSGIPEDFITQLETLSPDQATALIRQCFNELLCFTGLRVNALTCDLTRLAVQQQADDAFLLFFGNPLDQVELDDRTLAVPATRFMPRLIELGLFVVPADKRIVFEFDSADEMYALVAAEGSQTLLNLITYLQGNGIGHRLTLNSNPPCVVEHGVLGTRGQMTLTEAELSFAAEPVVHGPLPEIPEPGPVANDSGGLYD